MEGLCPLEDEESFWQLENRDAFVLQKIKRRTLRPGKGGKGRKGKCKGKRRRGSFNPFRKAPTSGKANMADEITTDQAYWEKKGSKNPWFKKGKGTSWNKSKDYKGKDSGKDTN